LAAGLNQRYEQNTNSEDGAFAFQQNEQNMIALASDLTQYFDSTDKPGEVACAHQQNDTDGNAVNAMSISIDAKKPGGNLIAALQELMGRGFDMTGIANVHVCEAMGWTVLEDGKITESRITYDLNGQESEEDFVVNVKNVLLAVVRRLEAAINEIRCKVQDCDNSKKAMTAIGTAIVTSWDRHGIRGSGTQAALKQGWSLSSMPLIFNARTGKLGVMCKTVSWVEIILVIGGLLMQVHYCFVFVTVATLHADRQKQ
jgi:hypothetical protein